MMRAQGATEYLVLLAVVLIVALVSVALLGFFPGMASDAQVTQSQAYWKGAQPIAIIENGGAWYATPWAPTTMSTMIVRIRNVGAYPVRITKVLGGGASVGQYYNSTGYVALSIPLASGEETCIGNHQMPQCSIWSLQYDLASAAQVYLNVLNGSKSACDSSGKGTLVINDFGFEYVETVEGQQITKREIGKPLIVKCNGAL